MTCKTLCNLFKIWWEENNNDNNTLKTILVFSLLFPTLFKVLFVYEVQRIALVLKTAYLHCFVSSIETCSKFGMDKYVYKNIYHNAYFYVWSKTNKWRGVLLDNDSSKIAESNEKCNRKNKIVNVKGKERLNILWMLHSNVSQMTILHLLTRNHKRGFDSNVKFSTCLSCRKSLRSHVWVDHDVEQENNAIFNGFYFDLNPLNTWFSYVSIKIN